MKTIFAVAAAWTAAVGAVATPAHAGVPSVLWCHQDLPDGRFANQRFDVQIDSDSEPALYEVHVYAETGEASRTPSAPVSSTDPASERPVTVLIDETFFGVLVAGDRLDIGGGYLVDYGASSVYVWLPGMSRAGQATGCTVPESAVGVVE
jgi:hypothetical protein